MQCSVPKLSEVLQRVEGDQLAAACKILAVAVTDRDSYALERRDDVEVKMRSRDTNKVNPGSNYCLLNIFLNILILLVNLSLYVTRQSARPPAQQYRVIQQV